jgi:hypothetical protein
MAPAGANFSAPFSSYGALDMTQLTRILAHRAGETGKTTFTASVAVFLLSGLLSGVTLADTIFKHGGHTYKIVTEPASWAEASEHAGGMSLGSNVGYLARINSARENAAILDAVMSHLSEEQLEQTLAEDGSDAPFIWLGGSDAEAEGVWIWSNNGDQFWSGDFNGSGVADRYTNWGVQPDSATGEEDALAMGLRDWPEPFFDLGSTGQWNDLDVSTTLVYVVEFDGTSDLRVAIEEPAAGGVHSGIGMIRGWAVSSDPIERVEVYVDGEYLFDIPYGGTRRDVANIFDEIPNSDQSGYASAVNFNGLEKGDHELTIRVSDSFGSVTERSIEFGVTRFVKSFISAEEYVELGWAGITALGKGINIRGARIGDQSYNISLEWRVSSQNFEITSIEVE